jgi:hypothetical protein
MTVGFIHSNGHGENPMLKITHPYVRALAASFPEVGLLAYVLPVLVAKLEGLMNHKVSEDLPKQTRLAD